MQLKLNLGNTRVGGLVLAKVGNPTREEPLQTSKELFEVDDEDQDLLSGIFLRPFRNLQGQQFHHHSSLEKHEMNACAAGIFANPDTLLENGVEMAKRLYSKSNHPNIKSGDLCISLIENVVVDDQQVRAICILKSESVTPFLSISARDGDLELSTDQGINPEKIDKGCLIVDHFSKKGYYVLTFDRAGNESRFWVRDFLGVMPISDSSLLSKKVAEMAVSSVAKSAPVTAEESDERDDSPPWEVNEAAKEALSYFDGKETFSMQDFEENGLRTPEAKAKFAEQRQRLEEEEGMKFEDDFDLAPREVSKAKKLMKSVMKLDSGVELRLKPHVVDDPAPVLEKGYDEEKGMNYVKVYYHKDLA